jgi:hypothetical protein
MKMTEEDLKASGITVEPFVHRHGSPHGRYWGYVVKNANSTKGLYHGSKTAGSNLTKIVPFINRRTAIRKAHSVFRSQQTEDQNKCPKS